MVFGKLQRIGTSLNSRADGSLVLRKCCFCNGRFPQFQAEVALHATHIFCSPGYNLYTPWNGTHICDQIIALNTACSWEHDYSGSGGSCPTFGSPQVVLIQWVPTGTFGATYPHLRVFVTSHSHGNMWYGESADLTDYDCDTGDLIPIDQNVTFIPAGTTGTVTVTPLLP